MLVSQINGVASSLPVEEFFKNNRDSLIPQADGSHEDAEDMETGEGLTFEDVQQEAEAKQRAFESQQAKTSTSGNGGEKGDIILNLSVADFNVYTFVRAVDRNTVLPLFPCEYCCL